MVKHRSPRLLIKGSQVRILLGTPTNPLGTENQKIKPIFYSAQQLISGDRINSISLT